MLLNGFRYVLSFFSGCSCRWCGCDFAIWTLESTSFKLPVADLSFFRSIFCDWPFCRGWHRCFCPETCPFPHHKHTCETFLQMENCAALGFQLGEGRCRLDTAREMASSCSVAFSFTRTAIHPGFRWCFPFPTRNYSLVRTWELFACAQGFWMPGGTVRASSKGLSCSWEVLDMITADTETSLAAVNVKPFL